MRYEILRACGCAALEDMVNAAIQQTEADVLGGPFVTHNQHGVEYVCQAVTHNKEVNLPETAEPVIMETEPTEPATVDEMAFQEVEGAVVVPEKQEKKRRGRPKKNG